MRFEAPWTKPKSSLLEDKEAAHWQRRDFLKAAGLGGAALLMGERPSFAGNDFDPSSVAVMEFDVSYRTEIMNLPSDAEQVRIWMPLPPSDYAQQVTDLEIDCPHPYEITRDKIFGTQMLYVPPSPTPEPYSVEARYHVRRSRVATEAVELDQASLKKYLQLTSRVRYTGDVETFAGEVVGDTTDAYEVGKRVFFGIQNALVYDSSIPGCGTGDTEWIMRHRRGKCDDYHALFMAIMISKGIPVRWEQGFPLPFPDGGEVEGGQLSGDCSGAHCWASFYVPDRGWVPVDVSEGDKIEKHGDFYFGQVTPNRFKVSEGRSVIFNPKQGGEPLPNFAFAYAEADEIPLIYHANYENIIKYDITHVEMA